MYSPTSCEKMRGGGEGKEDEGEEDEEEVDEGKEDEGEEGGEVDEG